ncbi:MAG: transcription elongation factor GreA [Phycisphaerales bacterium]|nr:transcription elongation factor GreA [Phycisphaerales bacterium]
MDVITQSEKDKIQARLRDLVFNRPVITARIGEARALGDLKENAEYHAAREQQGLEEAEIRRLEERIRTAQVVNESTQATGVVFIGSTVQLREVGDDEIELYRLVGEATDSSDPEVVEVTASSPMGDAPMKARVGEIVRVKAPRGIKEFEIVGII